MTASRGDLDIPPSKDLGFESLELCRSLCNDLVILRVVTLFAVFTPGAGRRFKSLFCPMSDSSDYFEYRSLVVLPCLRMAQRSLQT